MKNLLFSVSADEEEPIRSVNARATSLKQQVKIFDPRECDPRQQTQQSGSPHRWTKRGKEIAEGPYKARRRTPTSSALDLIEVSKEPPVPEISESVKIERSHVHLLHKRRNGINTPAGFQHPHYLINDSLRVEHVLEDRGEHDEIKLIIGKRKLVSVAYYLDSPIYRNVRSNDRAKRRGQLCQLSDIVPGANYQT